MFRQLIARLLRDQREAAGIVLLASILLNVIVFAGPLYMMLVYDSVLPSHSIPTLLGLFAMLLVLYAFQGLFETIRAEAMLDMARKTYDDLAGPVRDARLERAALAGDGREVGSSLLRDLDQVHGVLAGPGPIALIDLPWVLPFLVVLALLHWALGVAALAGVVVLAGIAAWARRRSDAAAALVHAQGSRRSSAASAELRFDDVAIAMGMRERLRDASAARDRDWLASQGALARVSARFGGIGRIFRLALQSSILTVGALLVIDGKASGGVIFASSILAGRALAPVDQAIANWGNLAAARQGWRRIMEATAAHPPRPIPGVELAPPRGELAVRGLWVAPPGTATFVVRGVSFVLAPGDALGIIGPSASGKTTLVKALLGIWPAARGEVRLDGATRDQWHPSVIGAATGYVPQNVELLAGTVAQNIARFDPAAQSHGIVAAARAAGMHETILALPHGYDTVLSEGGPELSGGHRQRMGLARALYGDPFLVALDEPNSNLDAHGDAALDAAIMGVRRRGGIVAMVTHRPSTLGAVSHIAVMAGGELADFGRRDDVLARLKSQSAPKSPRPAESVATR